MDGDQKRMTRRAATGSLFRFGGHFNGVDQRVVYDRLELQQDVALFLGRDAGEGLFQGAVGPARFFEDVEVLQQRFAITEDVKDAAAGPAAHRIGSAEVPLGESERDRVSPRRHWNGVGEIAVAFDPVKFRVGRSRDGPDSFYRLPAFEIAVWGPFLPIFRKDRRVVRGNPDRMNPPRNAAENLNRVEQRLGVRAGG